MLPTAIKHYYFVASSTSRALTVDAIIINYLEKSNRLTQSQKYAYLETYKKVRAGTKFADEEQENFRSLSFFIKGSDLPESVKFIYEAAGNANNPKSQQDLGENVMLQTVLDAFNNGGEVPNAIKTTLNVIGAETATGVSLGSLAGGAATNSMLVFLGGGSVASGGLGMLGGLAVMTGGAALVGAAGLLSLLFVSKMDAKDLTNLGIAIGGGTLTGAAGVFAAWTIAGALGVAETLSGAAAISTTIAALGGLSVLTGGAALVASGATVLIWSFLQSHKTRNGNILRELETRSYTLNEVSIDQTLARFISEHIPDKQKDNYMEYFSAPLIPLDKLAKALSSWMSPIAGEKILGLVDTSIWDDAKEGIIFTNQRIVWKPRSSSCDFITYQELNHLFSLPVHLLGKIQRHKLSDLLDILGDSNSEINDFLVDVSQEFMSLNSI